MCSIGSAQEISTVGGTFIVKLNGLVMHRTSSIQSNPGKRRQIAQLYLIEPSQAVGDILSYNPSLYPLLTTLLEGTPRRGNSFVPSLLYHGRSRTPIFDEGSRPA